MSEDEVDLDEVDIEEVPRPSKGWVIFILALIL